MCRCVVVIYYSADVSTVVFSYSHAVQYHTVMLYPSDLNVLLISKYSSELLGTLCEKRHNAG